MGGLGIRLAKIEAGGGRTGGAGAVEKSRNGTSRISKSRNFLF
jgi:hypothetical protein